MLKIILGHRVRTTFSNPTLALLAPEGLV